MKPLRLFGPLVFISGFAALCLETVWLRRLALSGGSAGFSAVATLSIYIGGLGFGGWIAGRKKWTRGAMSYAALEMGVVIWALLFPLLSYVALPLLNIEGLIGVLFFATPLLAPPAIMHGATLPALCSSFSDKKQAGGLYAINTFGAVMGTLASAFLLMPEIGVRGTEIAGAMAGLMAAYGGWRLRHLKQVQTSSISQARRCVEGLNDKTVLACALITGGAAMALEVIWARLGALLIGGSVYAFAVVLAVFLIGISLGAELGRRLHVSALRPALALTGLLALCGGMLYGILPHGLAIGWAANIQPLWSGTLLLALGMAGAPIASGAVFSLCIKALDGDPKEATGKVLAANALGGFLGVVLTGTLGLPALGISGVLILIAAICVGSAAAFKLPRMKYWKRGLGLGCFGIILLIRPPWEPAVYAVGLYNSIGEFVDLSPRAIDRFIHEGWDLAFYKDGQTASVAIGKSRKSNNIWLSINGKVDASSGADMPTQILSGQLPMAVAHQIEDPSVLVVGLASGVTLGEALQAGATTATVIELEPAVVEASRFFSAVNHSPLDNPRTTLKVDDARAVLTRESRQYDVIISEPSNPWLTGVSNLFTKEYWELGQKRLKKDGVFCQWVQLYALSDEGMRSIIATYLSVFPNTWLFETIPGSDALLISATSIDMPLPLEPTLGPAELAALSKGGTINTDDMPWIEFEAPKWIHKRTGKANKRLIEAHKP